MSALCVCFVASRRATHLVFFLGSELNKRGVNIIQRWCGNVRGPVGAITIAVGLWCLGLGCCVRAVCAGRAWGRGRLARCWLLRRQTWTLWKSWDGRVRVSDAIGHHRALRSTEWVGRTRCLLLLLGRVVAAIAVGRDRVGDGGGLGRLLVALVHGTLGQVLLLTTSILRANLLAVDALDRETLLMRQMMMLWSVEGS